MSNLNSVIMSTLNSLVVVAVSGFGNAEDPKNYDKNNKRNLFLRPIAGRMPNKAMVISGTVAESEELISGKTYLVQVTEGKVDPTYGRQFHHTKLNEISAMDTIDAVSKLGDAVVIDVTTPEGDPEGSDGNNSEGTNVKETAAEKKARLKAEALASENELGK